MKKKKLDFKVEGYVRTIVRGKNDGNEHNAFELGEIFQIESMSDTLIYCVDTEVRLWNGTDHHKPECEWIGMGLSAPVTDEIINNYSIF